MEIGRRRSWPPLGGHGRKGLGANNWAGLTPSLATLAALAALDVAMGGATIITTSYALAAFPAALYGGRWSTLLTAVLAVGLATLSPVWNGGFASSEYLVRVAIVALASTSAVFAAWLQADSRASLRRFALLNDLTAAGDGSMPLPDAMRMISDLIVPGLADFCMIDVVANGRIDRVAVEAEGAPAAEVKRRLREREPSLPEHFFETDDASSPQEPRFWERATDADLRSIAHDEEDLEFLRGLGLRSAITVPLTSRGRRVGALTLCMAWSGRRYGRDDLRFAHVLGDRVALALDNAGLFSDLQSVERRMDTAMAVLDQAVMIQDRSQRLVFANEAAARLFEFESPARLLEAPPGTIGERYDLYDEAGAPLDLELLPSARALRGENADAQIVRAISRRDGRELWLQIKSRAVEGMDGEPLYAVTAFEDLSELKRSEFAQTLLARMGELLASALDYDEMVERLAELVIPQLADWCTVYAARPDGSIVEVATAHADPAKVTRAREILSEYPLRVSDEAGPAEVLRTGEAIMVEDLDPVLPAVADDERHLELLRETGMGSAMMLPMRVAGAVVGALVLANQSDRRPFDDFDLSLGQRVADRAGAALESARLATERTEIAETLQRGLLPPPIPEIPGWSVAALYRPAGAENEVGGDFYDAFRFAGGWMLVIGDVTGRGARAASVTAIARYTLRTASALTGDPLEALAAVNRALLGREDTSLCSVAALAIREGDEEVKIAVAGHPPPLLVDRSVVREVAGPGPVLGAFPDSTWTLEVTRLEPGQQLVVYTDGVTEAAGPEGRFGEERLHQKLRGASSPGVALQRVEEALESFCGGALHDDAAIIALGPGEPGLLHEELTRLVDASRG
jgi:GAF domain-containing protein